MNTKYWGPGGWTFLHTITYNYPVKIDAANSEHQSLKKYTKQLFENLRHTLPCKYCRESFKKFLREHPIDSSLGSRRALTCWLYDVHNRVNDKLRRQEEECASAKLEALEAEVGKGTKSVAAAKKEFQEYVRKTMITGPDPTLEQVNAKYEAQRAKCGVATPNDKSKMASCRTEEKQPRRRRKSL